MRPFLLLALSVASFLHAQPPDYSLAGLVDAASNVPNRFSPNSRVTLYGARLTDLPPFDGGPVNVRVGRREVPVTYVSATQVNFILPGDFILGPKQEFFLARNGVMGPSLSIEIQRESPEFFLLPDAFVLAARPDGSLVMPGSPATPGSIVVLYANGLGATRQGGSRLSTPKAQADPLVAKLDIWLNGRQLPPESLLYAGLAPDYVALYQINVQLPDDAGDDPVIRLGFGGEASSLATVRLAVRGSGNGQAP